MPSYSKVHITIALGVIAVTAIVCSTVLAMNNKDVGFLGYAIAATVGGIAGIAVPSAYAKAADAELKGAGFGPMEDDA